MTFIITYFFTSSRADGEDYTRSITVKAHSLSGAKATARIEGFRKFGARFNDNCYDWKVAK